MRFANRQFLVAGFLLTVAATGAAQLPTTQRAKKGSMKRRRIEITAFRRRTAVYSHEKHPTEKHITEPGVEATEPDIQLGRKDCDESASFQVESPDNNDSSFFSKLRSLVLQGKTKNRVQPAG